MVILTAWPDRLARWDGQPTVTVQRNDLIRGPGLKDPDATTARVLVGVARDLGTHDREWRNVAADRTAPVMSQT